MLPFLRRVCGALAAAGLLSVLVAPVDQLAAQEPKGEAAPDGLPLPKRLSTPEGGYKEHREVEEPSKDAVRTFNQIMRGGMVEPDHVAAFNSVMRYQLAEFTFLEALPALPKKRADLKTRLKSAGNAAVPAAHKLYRDTARTEMARFCGAEYHPFVRVNAMLVIAELNDREATLDNRTPAVGDLESLKVMLAALADDAQLDGIKAGAMVGLERHAQLGIPDEKLKLDAIKAALSMLKPSRHEWLRRRAVMTLASIGVIGRQGEIADALIDLMANKNERISLRSEAARAFGHLNFNSGPPINFVQAITVLAHLTGDAIAATNPPNGRTDEDVLLLETCLSRIEIGLKGQPDAPAFNLAKRPPKAGMILVLAPGAPARMLLDDFTDNRFDPLSKVVYAYNPARAENFTRDLDHTAGQVDMWVLVHPLAARPVATNAPEKKDPQP